MPTETIQKLTFKNIIMTIGNLPSSYVESLSYYECMLWLCNYLQNTVIPAINNNGEAVEELQGLYVELKNYVDNYFTNLDIQTEINQKIDEMVANGTLTHLIKEYIDPINESFEDSVNSTLSSMQSQISSISSGSPAGVYATVADLTSDNPSHSRTYVVTADGKWYYYDTDNSQWAAGGTYQSTGIAEGSITGKETNFLTQVDSTNVIYLDPSKWFTTGTNGTKIINNEGDGNSNFTFTCVDNILNITAYNSAGYSRLSQFINLEPNTTYFIPFLNVSYNITGLDSKEINTTGTNLVSMDTTNYLNGRTFSSGQYTYYMISFYGTTRTENTAVYINEGSSDLGFEYPIIYKHNDKIAKIDYNDLDEQLQYKVSYNLDHTQWSGKKCSVIGSSLTANGGWTDILKSTYNFDKMYNRGVGASTITNLNNLGLPNYYPYCFVYNDITQYDESRDSVFADSSSSATYNCPAYYCSEGRIKLCPSDSDLVIIDIGTNDFYRCRQLVAAGTKTLEQFLGEDLIQINYADSQTTPTYDDTTFCGAMALAFKRIMEQCPNAKIICTAMPYNSSIATDDIESFNIFSEMYRCIKKMCFIFGVPYVDSQAIMGVNEYNLYEYMEDGVHPYKPEYTTEKGLNAYYRAIESVVKETYPIESE